MSLHESVKDSHSLELAIIENGGELTPELEASLTQISLDVAESVDRTHFALDRIENAVGYWKAKAAEYKKIADSLDTAHDRMKNYIKAVMADSGKSDLVGVEVRYKLSRAKPKVVIDEDKLAPAYFKEKLTLVPEKERIKQDLELGVPVDGARLEESFTLRAYPNKGDK